MLLEYFQMVDRIAALDLEALTIRAACRVPDASPVFEGHFPGYPILPGVLMIETMAQTGGWLVLARSGFESAAYLAQVKAAKMRDFVTPGQALTAEVQLQHEGSGYAVAAGRLSRGDKLVAEADLTFRVMRFPNETMRAQMRLAARRVGIPERPKMAEPADALITGIGLVSCLGEGPNAHWAALTPQSGFTPVVDAERFAPYLVHPLAPLDLERQIPKKGDQRQMEPWQRIGTYAAGLALDSAGVKGDADLLGRMDMIVTAGGGERDRAVDEALLAALPHAADPGVLLNERLTRDLRPTLFLAQLSNLLAGNISIVHGVVGSSRTFMGEEASGVDAVRIACARIAAGQGALALVGGSYNAERAEIIMQYALGGALLRAPFAPLGARQERGGGMAMGSLGCFLVIESRAHAEARGATAFAHIAAIASDRCARKPGEASANARRQFDGMRQHLAPFASAVLSGASGVAAPTQEERVFLSGLGMPVRATATALGHSIEPSFPANLALAATAIARGRLFGPLESEEEPMRDPLRSVLVTGWGHWRGEGMAVVVPA